MYHCLSTVKHAPSRELPLTARNTVFTHLSNGVLSDERQPEVDLSHSWTVVWPKFSNNSSEAVIALRQIERKKVSLPVAMRRSSSPLLKLDLYL